MLNFECDVNTVHLYLIDKIGRAGLCKILLYSSGFLQRFWMTIGTFVKVKLFFQTAIFQEIKFIR